MRVAGYRQNGAVIFVYIFISFSFSLSVFLFRELDSYPRKNNNNFFLEEEFGAVSSRAEGKRGVSGRFLRGRLKADFRGN